MSKNRLGRGLDALLARNNEEMPETPTGVLELPIELIHPNRYQPRTEFDEDALTDLANSISAKGIIQPLVVRPDGDGFELIAGERRFRAAGRLGLATVPVVVRDADDADTFEVALIENIQREDLNPIEKAKAYHDLIERFALTQEEAAQRVGQKRSTVANFLRLLDLPEEIQQNVSRGTLSMGDRKSVV